MKKIIEEKINKLSFLVTRKKDKITVLKELIPDAEANDLLINELINALTKYIEGKDSNGDIVLLIPINNYKQLIERGSDILKGQSIKAIKKNKK